MNPDQCKKFNKMNTKELELISRKIDVAIDRRQQHTQPSPATIKFMELMQNEIKEIKNDIKEIKDNYPTCDKMNLVVANAMKEATKEFWQEANDRFALKWTQTVVAGIVGAILLAALGIIVSMVQGHIKF